MLLQHAVTQLGEMTRDRRRALETERCAVCGDKWKLRLPDGAMVPYGGEDMQDPRTRLSMRYFACTESCLGKLRHDIEHRTFKALKDYDDEQAVRHLRPYAPPPTKPDRRARR